jgi:hypothetical protein
MKVTLILSIALAILGVLFLSAIGRLSDFKAEIQELRSERDSLRQRIRKLSHRKENIEQAFRMERLQKCFPECFPDEKTTTSESKSKITTETTRKKVDQKVLPAPPARRKTPPEYSDPRIAKVARIHRDIKRLFHTINLARELKSTKAVSEREYQDMVLRQIATTFAIAPARRNTLSGIFENYLPRLKERAKRYRDYLKTCDGILKKYGYDIHKVINSPEHKAYRAQRDEYIKEYRELRKEMFNVIERIVLAGSDKITKEQFRKHFKKMLDSLGAGLYCGLKRKKR